MAGLVTIIARRTRMLPGLPVARVTGVGASTTDTAKQPASVLAMIAAARNDGCLRGIVKAPLPDGLAGLMYQA
jgi:hypothetical protein